MTTLAPAAKRPETWTEELVTDKRGRVRQAGSDGAGRLVVEFRAAAERDLYAFAKGVLGYTLLNETFHRPACARWQRTPPRRKLELWARGHLKTTTVKATLLHALIQPDGRNVYFPDGIGHLGHSEGTSTRILLASKTADLARATLLDVEKHLEGNALLRGLWPECVWEDARRQSSAWNAERFFLPRRLREKEATVETIGVGGTRTGYHFDFHFLDDLIDLEDANSPVMMAGAIQWFHASRAFMHDRSRSLELVTGTYWSVGDLYQHIELADPSVEVTRCPLYDPDGAPIFPEVFTPEVVEDLRRDPLFPLLYLLSPTDPALCDFDVSLLRGCAVEGEELVFDEAPADAMLSERDQFARARPRPGPRETGRRPQGAYDLLAARAEYLTTRRARAS